MIALLVFILAALERVNETDGLTIKSSTLEVTFSKIQLDIK